MIKFKFFYNALLIFIVKMISLTFLFRNIRQSMIINLIISLIIKYIESASVGRHLPNAKETDNMHHPNHSP